MDKQWFEMKDIRKRFYDRDVWIPLRTSKVIEGRGVIGQLGFKEEYFGLGSLAVPLEKKDEAEKLDWMDLGLARNHRSYVNSKKQYVPSDIKEDSQETPFGIYLVLSQDGNIYEAEKWHLHQDFIVSFNLRREGDSWVDINEAYTKVARLSRDENGRPRVLEVRSEYLKDYLCARNMALRVSSYRSRVQIVGAPGSLSSWIKNPPKETTATDRWEGRATAIGESGNPYGSGMAILHVSRTDVDPEIDVPSYDFPTDDVVSSKSWTKKEKGEKSYRIHGELWRNEWVNPSSSSPRVRGDKEDSTVYFITDATGKKETKKTLVNGSRWLWFKPEAIEHILSIRGSSLSWFTKDTGNISCSPGHGLHFGINSIGLINIYAKDIGLLPNWQQKIWAGFNISPDGKVSEELLSSQMKAIPAKTQAPENFLENSFLSVKKSSLKLLGKPLLREHEQNAELLRSIHRFRSVNQNGLFALAKDLNRLIVENVNTDILKPLIDMPEKENWGSIKILENSLALIVGEDKAHKVMASLVGVYDMRKGDAHLRPKDINDAMSLCNIDQSKNSIEQGYQLLSNLVCSLYTISEIVRQLKNK